MNRSKVMNMFFSASRFELIRASRPDSPCESPDHLTPWNPVKVRFRSGRNLLKSCVFRGTRRTPTGLKKQNRLTPVQLRPTPLAYDPICRALNNIYIYCYQFTHPKVCYLDQAYQDAKCVCVSDTTIKQWFQHILVRQVLVDRSKTNGHYLGQVGHFFVTKLAQITTIKLAQTITLKSQNFHGAS